MGSSRLGSGVRNLASSFSSPSTKYSVKVAWRYPIPLKAVKTELLSWGYFRKLSARLWTAMLRH